VVMPFAGDPPGVPEENPTGLYRRTFRVPRDWAGRRVVLTVGAAESVLHAWVNGVEVGSAKDSRLPSSWDATDQPARGGDTLALAVVQWSDASWIEDQDQWWMPGIHRGITLTALGPVHVADLVATAGLELTDDATGTLDLEVRVGPEVPEGGWTVEAVVVDRSHRPVARMP